MLNHTYTSVKNANVVDCGKKEKIPSQPFPLLRDNFLGEYRTELDKKKVLANLGIATELSLVWENIQGDIGKSQALMKELDSRTKYTSILDPKISTVIEGLQYIETIIGGEEDAEAVQNERLEALETSSKELLTSLQTLDTYIKETVDVDINTLEEGLSEVSKKVENITELIQVSTKENNALTLITGEETPGLYVPDLSEEVSAATENIGKLQEDVKTINESLEDFVTKEELGGGDFDFVNQDDFDDYVDSTEETLDAIQEELAKTVKTDSDGHVNKLYVNEISNNNSDTNTIKITDSFEMTTGVPLDVRFVVDNLDQLHSLKPLVCYAGMGVIVKNQASLYILREPANGIIDEEYIKDEEGINWKCPEDLIIEVLTQEEYDKKVEEDSINPNMFYYIHEEVVEEPKREDFDSDEAYTEALNKWLRVLQQKYMSAVWGQDIENLVASKAPATAVKSLEAEIQRLSTLINSLSGGASEINLKDLNTQVQKHEDTLNTLTAEGGTIPTIQKDLSDLQTSVTNDYVTKQEITVEDPKVEYIFVKKSAFEAYTKEHADAIAESLTTKQLIASESITVGDDIITTSQADLLFNSERVALTKEVPVIELIDLKDYENKTEEELDDKTYYYIYNDDERHVLDSEFTDYKTFQGNTNTILNEGITKNKSAIGDLEQLKTENKTTLVVAINEISDYVGKLDGDLGSLLEDNGTIIGIQNSITALETTLAKDYVTIQAITVDDPNKEYIFVKKSAFEAYTTKHDEDLAKQVSTETLVAENISLGDSTITTEESKLLFNNEAVALSKEVPIIQIMEEDVYNKLEKPEENTYYYLYDTTNRYLLESELTTYKTQQSEYLTTLSNGINTNKTSIGELTNLTTENKNSLVLAVNEVNSNLSQLVTNVGDLTQLPEGITQIIGAITDIYSKISELTDKVKALEERISSLEAGGSTE